MSRAEHVDAAAASPFRALVASGDAGDPLPGQLGPDCPAPLLHVLEWFMELSGARGGSGFGPSPIGWADIDAWSRLTGRFPTPHEVGCIRALDALLMKVRSEGKGKKK